MSKELICPECLTEYWGPYKDAQCGWCKHPFTIAEKTFQRNLEKYLSKRNTEKTNDSV